MPDDAYNDPNPASQRVITLFHESIEAKMHTGESLAGPLAAASELMTQTLLGGGKILSCGHGLASAQAQILTACLINRFEQDRPSLPCLTLGTDATSLSAISSEQSPNDIYAKQLRALGQEGDVLVVINGLGDHGSLLRCISTAHDAGIRVIALTGGGGGDAATLLDHSDIELRAAVDSATRVHELHLLSIFCLCDLIDQHLFGGMT